jgi:hypothetical protein
VEATWGLRWRDTRIKVDGAEIGTVPTQAELKQGRTFQLPDGSQLTVKLGRQYLSPALQLTRDGRPLPGSGSDPASRLSLAYGIIFFVGAINIILGIAAVAADIDVLKRLGLGYATMVLGLIYLVLGYFVRRRSTVALVIAIALFAVDTVLAAALGAIGAVVARVFFLIVMFGGFSAIRELKQANPPPSSPEGQTPTPPG